MLITGASGFVGANLAHGFFKLGYDIHLFVRPSSDLWRIRKIKNKLKIHTVDLLDNRAMKEAVKKINPEVVFHCAAYGAHTDSQKDQQLMMNTNFFGTVNLLEACMSTDFKCFINTGSSSEYGEVAVPMAESRLLKPNNFYGVTKAAATMYCGYVARKCKKPIITLRLFSPYGYLDSKDRLIPKLIIDFLAHREKIDLYSASAVRDYIFIDDVVRAYKKAVSKGRELSGRIFNIGSGAQFSVKDVVGQISKIFDRYPEITYGGGRFKQHEPKVWISDISAAKKYLEWSPKYDFSTGITKTIKWFKSNSDNYDR